MHHEMDFDERWKCLSREHERLIQRENIRIEPGNGIFYRYRYPVLTREHTPLYWRYDLDRETNPYLMERMGINAVFNAGAMEWKDRIVLVARVEGNDRKSFFAVAESDNGIDRFRFREHPILMPETDDGDVNVYDMRLTEHEDGWIYGVFCSERKDSKGELSAALAQAGIARTKDLIHWERLADLKTPSPQQRNVVLHPEFVNGKYAFYTRPMDEFIDTGSGGGIGWGLADHIEKAVIHEETIIEERRYHTINEAKNGMGPPPIKTEEGWLHLAHGVRMCAAGLRYVLYCFMTDLKNPSRLVSRPAGLLIGPRGEERTGDVSNVVFSNGWVAKKNGDLFIYYASSDTRMHVATSTVGRLVDYCMHTPPDGLRTALCVQTRDELIQKNLKIRKQWET